MSKMNARNKLYLVPNQQSFDWIADFGIDMTRNRHDLVRRNRPYGASRLAINHKHNGFTFITINIQMDIPGYLLNVRRHVIDGSEE